VHNKTDLTITDELLDQLLANHEKPEDRRDTWGMRWAGDPADRGSGNSCSGKTILAEGKSLKIQDQNSTFGDFGRPRSPPPSTSCCRAYQTGF
jgi:hypothetical protein